MTTQLWFADMRTRLLSDTSYTSNLGYQESHAKNIFDKYFSFPINKDPYIGKGEVTDEWLSTILHRGTSQDKILALAFLVKSDPKSSLHHLESLVCLVSPTKRHSCLKAIDVLTHLLNGILLPNSRALISLENRPFDQLEALPAELSDDLSFEMTEKKSVLSPKCREYVLCLWYYEHQLKNIYFRFVTALENILLSDTIPAEKNKALCSLVSLVERKPENRETILGILINKLGDRSKGVASGVVHKLRSLVSKHPFLKPVLVDQLRILLFRPNLVDRAKYYAITLLSTLPLSHKTPPDMKSTSAPAVSKSSIADTLLKIYLAFFKASVEAVELPERLTISLLTGISRCAPYLSDDVLSSNLTDIDSVFRLVHVTSNFNISLQALSVLYHFTSQKTHLRDRYFQALYRKLTDPSIRWMSRSSSLLHLIFQSIVSDQDADRRAAFVQRLLNMCLSHPDACLVSGLEILLEKLRSSTNFSPPIICLEQSTEKCEALREKPEKLFPTSIGPVKQTYNEEMDSDDECFPDILSSDDESNTTPHNLPSKSSIPFYASWDHRTLDMGEFNAKNRRHKNYAFLSRKKVLNGFDMTARNPRFANALNQPCWQLVLLCLHVHPTVSLFSRNLISGKAFKYTGDPFDDLSVLHFIERFVYKKPKTIAPSSKANQAVSKPGAKFTKPSSDRLHAKTLPVDSLAYRNLNPDKIPSEEKFIHSYFNFVKKSSNPDGNNSEDSLSDADFDEYLQKHERGLIPDDIGDDDELSDNVDYSSDEEDSSMKVASSNSKKQTNIAMEGEQFSDENEDISVSDEEESEDEFGPGSSKNERFGKMDLNRLFVSADEVGDLYDTQENPSASKRQKFDIQRLHTQNRRGKSHASFRPTGFRKRKH